MPYITLVQNKVQQEAHVGRVLGIYGGVSNAEIEEYILTHEVKKIAVTYDSLPRVIAVLESMGIDAYKQFFLLVDEWHVLFNSYVFRNEAVKELLAVAPKFNEVTYMTATPIEQEYMFDIFTRLPVVEVV